MICKQESWNKNVFSVPSFLKSDYSYTIGVHVINSSLTENTLLWGKSNWSCTALKYCQPYLVLFYGFAIVSAEWVKVDMELSCHAASQQGITILFNTVWNPTDSNSTESWNKSNEVVVHRHELKQNKSREQGLNF